MLPTALPSMTSDSSSILPSSLKQAASQAPTTPKPLYSGPAIAPIGHVAQSLGIPYTHNAMNGTVTVNGQMIKPISINNGVPHAPVHQIAAAGGVPSTNVHTTPTGVNIMPSAPHITPGTGRVIGLRTPATNVTTYSNPQQTALQQAPMYMNQQNGVTMNQQTGIMPSQPQTQTQTMPQSSGSTNESKYGQYWGGVLDQGGAYSDPSAYGQTPQQRAQEEASRYGIPVSDVQILKSGHTFVPAKYVQQWLDSQAPTQQTQTSPQDTLTGIQNQYLGAINSSAPQAPVLQQIPGLDPNSIQPFQWNAQQDFMNQYNNQLPGFMQTLATANQGINDQMNRRGIYNSGIAQQVQDTQDQGLYQKLYNTINTNQLADQKQAATEYQNYVANQLSAYRANVEAMYKNGQLSNQQYADAINEWGHQVSALQAAMSQQASLVGKMLPYQYQTANNQADNALKLFEWQNPSAGQQLNYQLGQDKLAEDMQKAQLPYEYMTKYQQAEAANQSAKLAYDQWSKQETLKLDYLKEHDTNAYHQEQQTYNQQKAQIDQSKLEYDATKTQLGYAVANLNAWKTANPGQTPPANIQGPVDTLMGQLDSIANTMNQLASGTSTVNIPPAQMTYPTSG